MDETTTKRQSTLEGYLDLPFEGQALSGFMVFQGWALELEGQATEVELTLDEAKIECMIHRLERPDVAAAFPGVTTCARPGFAAGINVRAISDGSHKIALWVTSEGRRERFAEVIVEVSNDPVFDFYRRVHTSVDLERRQRKLAAMVDLLACTECRGAVDRESQSALRCTSCHRRFAIGSGVPIMSVDDHPIDEDLLQSPPSNHQYPAPVLERLEAVLAAGGMALDIGSGRRLFGADGLIQLEICAYPFTDVVNQSTHLPFRDGAFDFVFSLAVTEHVKKPWVLAAEMQRVTRPGGAIFVDSAFLQPIHGYPDHYFNMTDSALRELFGDLEIESLEPALYQHPWFSVRWILSSLVADLDAPARAKLLAMNIESLLFELEKRCRLQPSELDDIRLPRSRVAELAAGFTLIGRKPET